MAALLKQVLPSKGATQHPDFKMHEAIHRVNGYDKSGYTYYPVVIIGAGESGIAMGCQLKDKLGFDQFRIFDRQAGIGGTWWVSHKSKSSETS